VKIGDGEMQRRAYGEKGFPLVIQRLKHKNQLFSITAKDVSLRERGLRKIIPLAEDKERIFDEEIERVRREMK
jgi:hypothetical protein